VSRRTVFHDGISCARGYIGRPRSRWKDEFNSETEQPVEHPVFMKKKPLYEHCLTYDALSVYHCNKFWRFRLMQQGICRAYREYCLSAICSINRTF